MKHRFLLRIFFGLFSFSAILHGAAEDQPEIYGEVKDKPYDYLIKLMMIGDSGVGKSCLLLRFVEDCFTPNFITTIGIDFKIRTITHEGKTYKIQIWDTAGQERYRTITCAYYRGAMGVMVVYDVTDKKSFDHIEYWMQAIGKHSAPKVDKILVGNKCDRQDFVCMDTDWGQRLADRYGIPFFETSAKNGQNVEEAFMKLFELVKARLIDGVTLPDETDVVLVKDHDAEQEKDVHCCFK